MGIIRKVTPAAIAALIAGVIVETGFAAPSSVLSPNDFYEAATNIQDLRAAVISIINYFLGFLGLVAIIVIIFSGVKLVASAGNDAAVKSAQKTLLNATLGLLLVFFAYAIVAFIVNFTR